MGIKKNSKGSRERQDYEEGILEKKPADPDYVVNI